MFRSATFKLTMWYLAIVMAISLVFSIVLYRVATSELDRGLHNETQRIYRQFPVFEGNPLLKPGEDYDNGAHRILLRLIGFNFVVLVGAGVSSYWLARRTLEPIEAAHEQQKRFTADVSHELRTPLTALKMESEVALMNSRSGAKELRRTIESNLEEVAKLENLLGSLIRLSKLESDELRQNFTDVNLANIAKAALEQVRTAARGRGIKLESDMDQAPKVQGDAASLTQLLVILLDNAIKYSARGSTVKLSTGRSEGMANVVIEDQGKGIDPASLEHVFDRFYRADESRAKEAGATDGHGLGLSIAKVIADLHDGSISLTSRVGHGTTATVRLPLAANGDNPA